MKLPNRPVNIVEPESDRYEMPEGFEGYDVETIGGLNPTVVWDQPGENFFGKYVGTRTLHLGNREQTLHQFELDEKLAGKKGFMISVWGSTVLDNRILEASPKMGQILFLRYTGLGKNASKGNPPKLFDVMKLTPKQ